MAIKRSDTIDNETLGFYHLTSRCVRQALLCGVDKDTEIPYEYRREWIESRILLLTDLFAIEVCGYAVMQNHYHLVVYFGTKAPWRGSDNQVAERWLTLLYPPVMTLYSKLDGSISWLMRCLNEPIAKRSNAEDFVKGHF